MQTLVILEHTHMGNHLKLQFICPHWTNKLALLLAKYILCYGYLDILDVVKLFNKSLYLKWIIRISHFRSNDTNFMVALEG